MPKQYQINQEGQGPMTLDPYRSDGMGWEITLGYTGANVTTITRTAEDGTAYVKTITYSGSDPTAISAWILQ